MQERLRRTLIVAFVQFAMMPILFLALTFLYFIGADNALSTGNVLLYNIMVPSSLALSVETRGLGGFGLGPNPSRKVSTSTFFGIGGLLMMLNWIIPEFMRIPYSTATLLQHAFFDIVVGGGMIGIFIFLMGFFSMASNYVESKLGGGDSDSATPPMETLDKWLVSLRNACKTIVGLLAFKR